MIFVAKAGEVFQPRTGKKMQPHPLGEPPIDDPVDRRRALAKWLTTQLAVIATACWWWLGGAKGAQRGQLDTGAIWLGKGLVNPDRRPKCETNLPSNPELLDALADLASSPPGFDLKALIRQILNSRRVYQHRCRPHAR